MPGPVILGVSCDYHDAAAALVVDGTVIAAAEEERFSRRRHDASLPSAAVESCLRIAGVGAADVDHVAFYEQPLLAVHRLVTSHRRQGPAALASFAASMPVLVRRNLMVGYRISRLLRDLGATDLPPVSYLEHHTSHAAAAFYPSPFERAAVLTIDGIGEWATASIARGFDRHLEVLQETRYPDSLGLLYGLVTAYCGFRPNDGEYKLMGLAAYGEPRYVDALRRLADVRPDASLRVRAERLRWFRSVAGSRALSEAFGGPPRRADEPLTDRFADVAASIQLLAEETVLTMASLARDLTGETTLCLAGGVALNSVAIGRLRGEGPFDDVWVQPAAGDAGSAIGAALGLWHQHLDQPRRVPGERSGMSAAFLGAAASPDEAAAWLTDAGVDFTRLASGDLADVVSGHLVDGRIVGWSQGRFEFGPRALGHRSILADPRSPTVRARLNDEVKRREWFRPFAPAVLEDHAGDWFDFDGVSEFMSFTVQVAAHRMVDIDEEPTDLRERADLARSEIPACTHVDGSARVMTVSSASNPGFHELLTAFHGRTGCPVLVNTSFNGPGEPIVASPADALACARAIGLDTLVIEDCLIDLVAEREVSP